MVEVAISSGKGEAVFAQLETILDGLATEKGEECERATAGVLNVLTGLAGYASPPIMLRSTSPPLPLTMAHGTHARDEWLVDGLAGHAWPRIPNFLARS